MNSQKVKKVRKVVIPAAGFGTRFLPATKAQPKEMLPIVDKPIIQYVVEEAVEAGIEQVILVTGWHKRAIEDHFDRHFELEARLEKDGKMDLLAEVKRISELANFVYVRQKEPLGNGHALLVAREVVGDEPVVMLWGDDFITAKPSRTKQMIDVYEKYGSSVISAIRTTDPEDTKKYGYVAGNEVEPGIFEVKELVEKPGPDRAPSNLAVVSGYLFTPDIFDALERAIPQTIDRGQELYWADGVKNLMNDGKKVYAVEIKNARYYDCGSKVGYLKAVVDHGLEHADTNGEFREYLKSLKL